MLLTPKKIESMNAILESECPVCQCRMIVPTAIPACGHKFCFTCLKGICMNDMGCPMCRGPIDSSIFNLPSQVLDLKMDLPNSPTVEITKNTVRVHKQACTPVSLDLNALLNETSRIEEKHYWLYSGKNQEWWRFDPRHERDIEEAFACQNKKSFCEVIICGRAYIIDFVHNVQYPKGNQTQSRTLKCVTAEYFDKLEAKGLAGVYVPNV